MIGYKKLYRINKNKVLGGVCTGLGDYFNIDPVLVRIFFIISIFASLSITAAIYFVLWILTPLKY